MEGQYATAQARRENGRENDEQLGERQRDPRGRYEPGAGRQVKPGRRLRKAADVIVDAALLDPNGRDYLLIEVLAILRLRDPNYFRRMERRGLGPPVLRNGPLKSALRFPRKEFHEWRREQMQRNADER